MIILIPVLYDAFFNDIDHVKPYYPNGLQRLFSDEKVSKQYFSKFNLKLVDIYFRRSTLMPYNLRCRYKKDFFNRLLFSILSNFFIVLKKLSFGLFSKPTGYGAIFDFKKSK